MLSDLIFNSITHSTNQVMKWLALLSMVFLPITFLAGVYGMNFAYFPELQLENGVWHFWIWAGITVVSTLLITFRLGGSPSFDLCSCNKDGCTCCEQLQGC